MDRGGRLSGITVSLLLEWPIPDVDNENGPTRAGVGDLAWLTLFLVEGSKQWGALGLGPVIVFPTASHSEMGDGKYQVGPALGYVNKAVKGWQFALLLQQYFSVAGDPRRSRVNQLTLQHAELLRLTGTTGEKGCDGDANDLPAGPHANLLSFRDRAVPAVPG